MKKMIIVALVTAFAFTACGGKKKDNTAKPGSGSATMPDKPAGSDAGSAAPEAPKE
jgi:hypothetical protein